MPEIDPIVPIDEVPEIKEPVNLETKTIDANVKSPRASLFDTLLPGFIGKSNRRRETPPLNTASSKNEPMLNIYSDETTKSSEKQENQPTSDNNSRSELFEDPSENVDLPAFLRHRR